MTTPRLVKLICLAVAIGMLGPSAAGAATTTYEGGISGVGGASFSFDVATKRVKGKQVRKVTAVRGEDIPSYCRDGSSVPIDLGFRANARVSRGGSFEASRFGTDNDFDYLSYLRGRIDGADASGRLSYSGENPLFDSCSTGVLRFYADRVPR